MMSRLAVALSTVLVLSCGGGPAEVVEPPTPRPSSPAVVEATVAAADGVDIAYSVRGTGEPTLVFIHGWSCDSTYWQDQLPVFAGTHRVVAIDLPGHGRSGTDREAWTLPAYGDDVRVVVEHLGADPVVLIGHSMGAPVALEAAARMPGRVRAVIAVDSLHDAEMSWDPDRIKDLITAYEQDFTGTCDSFVRSMFVPTSDPSLVDRVATDMCAGPPEVGIALMTRYPEWDPKAALAAAGVPVRCINAPAFPTNLEANRRYAPDFDAVIMDGVGHFLMMEKPAEFNARLAEVLAGLG